MCAPVIRSILFNAASYNAGQVITATVTYTSCCDGPFTIAGSDDGGRAWTVTFNDGVSTATLTATA